MTEKLKTLMDESAEVSFATPDLDAIVRAGDRTVRHRRLLAGGAGLAAAAVLALGVAAVTGGSGTDRSADPAQAPDAVAEWADGTVLHTQAGTVDVGHPVNAYVRTSLGYVVADDQGTVWSVVDGQAHRVGSTDPRHPHLAGDDDAPTAAWIDTTNQPLYVTYDQAVHQVVLYGRVASDEGRVVAVDDGRLYVDDGRQARVFGPGDHEEADLDPPTAHSSLLTAEDGVTVWEDPGNDDGQSEYLIVRPGAEPVVIPWVHGDLAFLSPDAQWVTFDDDAPRVYDTRTGDPVDVDVDGREFATGYAWVGADTLAVIAGRGAADEVDGDIELLTCAIPAGSCTVSAGADGELGTFADVPEGFALPVGTSLDE